MFYSKILLYLFLAAACCAVQGDAISLCTRCAGRCAKQYIPPWRHVVNFIACPVSDTIGHVERLLGKTEPLPPTLFERFTNWMASLSYILLPRSRYRRKTPWIVFTVRCLVVFASGTVMRKFCKLLERKRKEWQARLDEEDSDDDWDYEAKRPYFLCGFKRKWVFKRSKRKSRRLDK